MDTECRGMEKGNQSRQTCPGKKLQVREKKEKKKKQYKPTGHDEWFGDEMIRSKTWPKNTKKNGTIRIFGQNVNGVSYLDNYSEWKIILETLHTQQCDVTCLTEMNIDVKNPEVKYALVHQAKMLDKNSHIIMTAS